MKAAPKKKKAYPLKLKTIMFEITFDHNSLWAKGKHGMTSTCHALTRLVENNLSETLFYKIASWSIIDHTYSELPYKKFPGTIRYYIQPPHWANFHYQEQLQVNKEMNENPDKFIQCSVEFLIKLIELMLTHLPEAVFLITANISYTGKGSRKLSAPVELFYDSKEGAIDWNKDETERN